MSDRLVHYYDAERRTVLCGTRTAEDHSTKCGHLTERTATFREEDLAGEDRGGWYARGSAGAATSRRGGSAAC